MDSDPTPLPDFELFPRLSAAGRFIIRFARTRPTEAPDFMSDHYRPSHIVDEGKSAASAKGVQLVIEGLQQHGRDE